MGPGWLQTGAVLNRVFEIHESHIPYLLQFKVSTVSLGLKQKNWWAQSSRVPTQQQLDVCLD